ncbi:MAG: hypothetical protein ACI4HL_05765 [Ruminococcus sp.]
MQYDRNDEITYDEDFKSNAGTEYYTGEENYQRDIEKVKEKKEKSIPSVLIFQLIVCFILGGFMYVSKNYFPDFFSTVMNEVNNLINDSLIVDGNNLNDYFVNNG